MRKLTGLFLIIFMSACNGENQATDNCEAADIAAPECVESLEITRDENAAEETIVLDDEAIDNTLAIAANSSMIINNGDAITANTEEISAARGMLKFFQSDGSLLGYITPSLVSIIGATSVRRNILTDQNYILLLESADQTAGVHRNTTSIAVNFEGTDCLGQGYARISSAEKINNSVGLLFKYSQPSNNNTDPWYYLPIGSTLSNFTSESSLGDNGCVSASPNLTSGMPVYLNDPDITGFSGLNNPLTIGF